MSAPHPLRARARRRALSAAVHELKVRALPRARLACMVTTGAVTTRSFRDSAWKPLKHFTSAALRKRVDQSPEVGSQRAARGECNFFGSGFNAQRAEGSMLRLFALPSVALAEPMPLVNDDDWDIRLAAWPATEPKMLRRQSNCTRVR